METDIVVQLIETGGTLVSLLGGFFAVKYFLGIKRKFKDEAKLLKEAAFYRKVIDLYEAQCRAAQNNDGLKRKFYKEAREALGTESPHLTQPAKIKERLRILEEMDGKLDAVLSKIADDTV